MHRTLVIFISAVLAAGGALAQAPGADMAAAEEEANRKFEEWLEATRAFIGDVTFDEGDVRSLIELWPEFSELGEEFEEDSEEHDELMDYREILRDARFRSWAAANGLSGEPWLKKTMRVITMVTRGQMETIFAQAEAQMPKQLEEIEGQRSQMGEEMYQQIKRSIEASVQMFKKQRAAWADMPRPVAGEQALLDKYHDDLVGLMMEGDEEEDWR